MGVVLWAADWIGSKERKIEDISLLDAILIGLSQALAIIPGVSRSGATITTARLLGIDRADAANFSFLMATPIIAGAGMIEIHKALHTGLTASLGWGFAASAAFGILAIAGLLRYLGRALTAPSRFIESSLASSSAQLRCPVDCDAHDTWR